IAELPAPVALDVEDLDRLCLADPDGTLQPVVLPVYLVRADEGVGAVGLLAGVDDEGLLTGRRGAVLQAHLDRLARRIGANVLHLEYLLAPLLAQADLDAADLLAVALDRDVEVKDQVVVDEDGVGHFEVRQNDVAAVVPVADANEEQWHSQPGGVLG